MSSHPTGLVEACLVVGGGHVVSGPVDALRLDFAGVIGDRHAGGTREATSREPWYPRGTVIRNDRQVTIVALEELGEIAIGMDLATLDPAWIGANLAVSGVAGLSSLLPGTRLFFAAGATLKIEAENAPCRIAGRSIAAHVPGREGLDLMFPKVARHRRGLVASVERPGTIAVGEAFRVAPPTVSSAAPAGALL